jgi:hypothetical protein
MNIDEYRALVAQESAEAESKEDQTAETQAEETPKQEEETTPPETKEETPPAQEEDTKPTDKIVIDGLGEVTLDDIKEWKNGHLRTEDYTKKTQEVARVREENKQAIELFNFIKSNPQLAEVLLQQNPTQGATQALHNANPIVQRQAQLEQQVYDLMLEKEISSLQAKYADFDVLAVLNKAQEKQMTNLEDAYKLTLADKVVDTPKQEPTKQEQIDINKLKTELRNELLKELESERNTSSIISSNSSQAPTKNDEPQLTDAERKVARMQGLSDADYVKWRDHKTK